MCSFCRCLFNPLYKEIYQRIYSWLSRWHPGWLVGWLLYVQKLYISNKFERKGNLCHWPNLMKIRFWAGIAFRFVSLNASSHIPAGLQSLLIISHFKKAVFLSTLRAAYCEITECKYFWEGWGEEPCLKTRWFICVIVMLCV